MDSPANGVTVLSVGLGRTGTSSLRIALEYLGFGPTYKGLIRHRKDLPIWHAAAMGQPVDWSRLFQGCRSVGEPAALFYRQLVDAFPNAKVILTVRDAERWYASIDKTVYRRYRVLSFPPLAAAWSAIPAFRRIRTIYDLAIRQGIYDGQFADKEQAIAAFAAYNAGVQAYVSPERLLVFDVKQGWGPLCAFLGVETPRDLPFPHKNTANGFLTFEGRRQRAAARVRAIWR